MLSNKPKSCDEPKVAATGFICVWLNYKWALWMPLSSPFKKVSGPCSVIVPATPI